MLSKNEVKYIQSLCHKKPRDEEGLFVAEGPKLAEELLASDFEIVKLYALAGWIGQNPVHQHVAIQITDDELKKVSNLQTPNQVVLIVKKRPALPDPLLHDNVTLVLDGLQDPGNMGSIIRIADWFGIEQIVAGADSVDVYNSKVIQASMGSICRVNIWYRNLQQWMSNSSSVPVYGALLKGQNLYEAPKISEGLVVIGNEGKGISEELLPYISCALTIPRSGKAESLNAAIAAGIIVSHLLKQ